jgi:hypothetical protein
VTTTAYDGMARLRHFNPDDDVEPLHPQVAWLRKAIGSVGGREMYGKPVAWINATWDLTGGADGLIADAAVRDRLAEVLRALAAYTAGA